MNMDSLDTFTSTLYSYLAQPSEKKETQTLSKAQTSSLKYKPI